MALPELDQEGLLPPGIHNVSVAELKEKFCYFRSSDRRINLGRKLERYLEDLKPGGLITEIIVDGSFVTAKEEPGDLDLILVLAAEAVIDDGTPPYKTSPLSRAWMVRQYGFDVLTARASSPELNEYIGWFENVAGRPELKKGMLRLRL
jgi:uncharacterized protein DUF6932